MTVKILSSSKSIKQFIKSEILTKKTDNTISLFTGLSSEILMQIEILRFTDLNISKKINDNIKKLYDLIELSESYSSTFCDGLSGVGWLILYLNDHKFIKISPDSFLKDFDEIIEQDLIISLNKKNYDLLHGAMGMGLYFLKRRKKNLVEKIIDSLSNDAIRDGCEYKWLINSSKKCFDFGLAHGQASVLYFLGKCYLQQICTDRCRDMISGIFNFYMQNIQTHQSAGSFWPGIINQSEYISGKNTHAKSRLAWCYGDIGILHTLFIVSGWISNEYINKTAQHLLLETVKRVDKVDTFINDPYFCHGSSGIACIYNSLYLQTNIKTFKDSAIYWLNKTVGNADVVSFDRIDKKTSDCRNSGILLGNMGILLALITMKSSDSKNWTECFFLQ